MAIKVVQKGVEKDMEWFWITVFGIAFVLLVKKLRNFRGSEGAREDNIIRPLFSTTTYEINDRSLTVKGIRQTKEINLASIHGLEYYPFFGRGTVKFTYRGEEYEMRWIRNPKDVVERISEGAYATRRRTGWNGGEA